MSIENYDIIVHILLWLPVKSLKRFRCVCKSWRALISDRRFVRDHMNRINSNNFKLLLGTKPLRSIDCEPLLNYVSNVGRCRELGYPVMVPNSSTKIFGSFNGLICLAFDHDNIILWNPCTRDSKLLPTPQSFFPENHGSYFYGFGYDSTSEDYKIVRGSHIFHFSTITTNTTVEVFSVKTGSWKIYQDIDNFQRLEGQGCLLNGSLHWLYVEPGNNGDSIRGLKIVSFDLAEEKLQVMMPFPNPLPVNIPDNRFNFPAGIGTMANCLTIYFAPKDNDLRIWMMKEYGVKESWIEVIKISLEELPKGFDLYLRPQFISEIGEVLMNLDKNVLALYDPREQACRNFTETHATTNFPKYWFDTTTYVETLVSPVTDSDSGM